MSDDKTTKGWIIDSAEDLDTFFEHVGEPDELDESLETIEMTMSIEDDHQEAEAEDDESPEA